MKRFLTFAISLAFILHPSGVSSGIQEPDDLLAQGSLTPPGAPAAASIRLPSNLRAFEGRINATLTRSGDIQTFHYTVGTNSLRIERGETNWPHAWNVVNLDTGAITLLFPHNRTFVRLKPAAENPASNFPGAPAMPPGIGPQSAPQPARSPGTPPPAMPMAGGMPAMPMMMPQEQPKLTATGQTKNLLGYTCTRYEIKQRGQVMEIWATDKLLPFQGWQQNQPSRFGPRMLEEQWSGLLNAKKLFPLLMVLKYDGGPEHLRFEVTTIKLEKVAERDGQWFQPPADYQEVEPPPF